MTRKLAAFLVGGALLACGDAALAHHSFAMYDYDHPIEIEGTVQVFKFVNPHSFISLETKGDDGSVKVWSLEGSGPNGLVRDGWSSRTIKPGDELKLQINPLRSGGLGGAWTPDHITYKDGRPVIAPKPSGD